MSLQNHIFEQMRFLMEGKKLPPSVEEKYGEILFGSFRDELELDTYEEASEFRALVIFISEIQKRRQSTKVIDAFHELLKVFSSRPATRIYLRSGRVIEGLFAIAFGAAGLKILTARLH